MNPEYVNISIITPVYKAERILEELVSQIHIETQKITHSFEIIMVCDGSPDNSWEVISELCGKYQNIVGINFSKNFGQHNAVTAGLNESNGEFVVIMDCDLQDSPLNIPKIVTALEAKNDIVFTRRIKRGHGLFKKLTAKAYNLLFTFLADDNFNLRSGSMLGVSRRAVQAYLSLKETERLYIQLFRWVGFKQVTIDAIHNERYEGKSSYSFSNLLSVAFQGLISNSNKLLKISITTGIFIALTSIFAGLFVVLLYFTQGFQPGWPSLFIGITFSSGIILVSNGILGLYIGKIFSQVKERPLFIVSDKISSKHLNS